MPALAQKFRQARSRAFTLLELLTVITIIGILSALVIVPANQLVQGLQLTDAADMVKGEFSQARQYAMARNVPVEVRIYQDEAAQTGGADKWVRLALVVPSNGGADSRDEWISTPRVLPGGTIFDDAQEFSTMISDEEGDIPRSGTETTTAPPALQGKPFRAFQFRPSGGTNLASGQPWCLTLRPEHSPPGEEGTPSANYVTVVLDPRTGRSLTFQP